MGNSGTISRSFLSPAQPSSPAQSVPGGRGDQDKGRTWLPSLEAQSALADSRFAGIRWPTRRQNRTALRIVIDPRIWYRNRPVRRRHVHMKVSRVDHADGGVVEYRDCYWDPTSLLCNLKVANGNERRHPDTFGDRAG
jgi:hypothetical protein